MEFRDPINQLQCIVDEGVLVQRRDMVRVLSDLGQVRYQEWRDGRLRRQGEGIIVHVTSNDRSATVVLNKRLYLNVNAFDYLQLGCDEAGGAWVDLVSDGMSLRLIPLTDPMDTPVLAGVEPVAQRGALDRLFGESFAEVYLDDDFEDSDDD
ncbi:MAG TPA: hypothetical protein V6D05_02250 [Stenomitos sp.]